MPIKLDKLAGKAGGDESHRLAKHWLDQIYAVEDNSEHKRWIKRGETIVKRYRDERNRTDEEGQRRYNSLWANVQILQPALYGKTPLPVVERRFKDKDPTGRNASQMLERALRNEIEICGFTEALEQAVNDYLLPGIGVVWVRYEPRIAEGVSLPPEPEIDIRDSEGDIQGIDTSSEHGDAEEKPQRYRARLREEPETGKTEELPEEESDEETDETKAEDEEEKLLSTGDRIVRESTPVDFIPWNDFGALPIRSRTWKEVRAVYKRVYMSRDQLKRRFGGVIGKNIPLLKDNRGDKTQNTTLQASEQDKAQVFEIWSEEDRTVYWVAKGYDYLCDRKDDPLTLENFYPVPRPIYANPTTNTLIPVPDFIQYQDQAIQIDELTQRIAMLAKACKAAGVYNAAAKDIQRLFNESVENELIPVDDWAAFAEKGGIEGNISFVPVKEYIGILNELMMIKQKQIEEMDRITGINDIMRGTSDARETLGGVRIKSNSTGTRLTKRQNEVARFARDTIRIMADIMSQHFSPQSLIEVSGALYEEGLGPEDMPDLTAVQNMQQQPQGAPGTTPSGPGGPPGAQPARPGLPAPTPPGAPPNAPSPQGGNVVPFRPPGQPPGAPNSPPGMPPSPQGPPQPGLPMAQPQAPQIPPQILEKMKALQRIAKAIGLLRDEQLRGFRVDIEVDSTIYGDQAQDKQDRNEFVTAVTQFLQQAMVMGAQLPESIPLLGKLLQFGARGHKIGRDLELAIEEFTDQAFVVAKQNQIKQQSQPNPEQMKAQVDLQKSQAQLQVAQIKAQSEQTRGQSEMQSTALKAQAEQQASQAEIQHGQIQNQADQMNAQADMQKAQSDMQMQQMQMQIEKLKLQIEYAKLQQTGMMTHQSQQATMQEQERTKQADIQGHHATQQADVEGRHATEQAKYQALAPKPEPKAAEPKTNAAP